MIIDAAPTLLSCSIVANLPNTVLVYRLHVQLQIIRFRL